MATNPRGHVRPGDKLRIAAEQINWINRQMAADTSFGGGPLAGIEPGKNIILAKNNTGGDVPRWGVMAIGGIEINPTAGDTQRRSFEEQPCITGTMPSDTTGAKFCIAVEPIKSGKIGRVSVAGVVQVKLTVASGASGDRAKPHASRETLKLGGDGPARVLWRPSGATGEVWGLVRIDEGNLIWKVGIVSADWSVGSTATVAVPEDDGAEYENVLNLSFNVAAGSNVIIGRFPCAATGTCPQPNGEQWLLLEVGEGTQSGVTSSCQNSPQPGTGSRSFSTIGGEDIKKFPGWDASKVQLLGHTENGCLKWFDTDDCQGTGP